MANEAKKSEKKSDAARTGVGLSPATMTILRKRIGECMAKTGAKETADTVIRAALEALK